MGIFFGHSTYKTEPEEISAWHDFFQGNTIERLEYLFMYREQQLVT